MEKKKGLSTFITVFFAIMAFALGGFIIYDKLLKDNNDIKETDVKELQDAYSSSYDELGYKVLMEDYLKMLPDKNESFLVKDLTDDEISMSVWKYIYFINGGFMSESLSCTEGEVASFLEERYGLKNYTVKLMSINDKNIYGLSSSNNRYVISVAPTVYGLTGYHVNSISFNKDTNELAVSFEKYMASLTIVKTGEGVATVKIVNDNEINNHFELVKVDYKTK